MDIFTSAAISDGAQTQTTEGNPSPVAESSAGNHTPAELLLNNSPVMQDKPSDAPSTLTHNVAPAAAISQAAISSEAAISEALPVGARRRVGAHPARRANGQKTGIQAELMRVRMGVLQVSDTQPRRALDADALQELAHSVHACGVLQPILVRPLANGPLGADEASEQRYEIVAGERRWRASQKAGLEDIPVLIQGFSDAEAVEIALIENLQRENLTPLETANALMQMTEQGYSIRTLATQLGKGKGWVEQHLRLARLPEDLQQMVSGRPDTATHARELEKVQDAAFRAELIALVLDAGQPLAWANLRQLIKKQAAIEQAAIDVIEQAAGGCGRDDGTPNQEDAPEQDGQAEQDGQRDDGSGDACVGAAGAGAAVGNEMTAGDTIGVPVQDTTPLRAEVTLLEAEAPLLKEEASSGSAPPQESFYEGSLMANLRTAQKRLPALSRPADNGRRQEMVQMLFGTRDAITATLTRWGIDA